MEAAGIEPAQDSPGCIGCGTREGLIVFKSSFGVHDICGSCLAGRKSVYLIGDSRGSVKIGLARDPAKRLSALQGAHASQLDLIAVITGGRNRERELHERFADARLRGEWFADTPEIRAAFGKVA